MILAHDPRRIGYVDLTEHRTAQWTAQQIVESRAIFMAHGQCGMEKWKDQVPECGLVARSLLPGQPLGANGVWTGLDATTSCGGVVSGMCRWHEPLRHVEQGVDPDGFV
jgi:hypothetical protein